MEIVSEAIFPDHHRFTNKDLASIEERSKGVDWIVTTEKDMVKLKKLNIDSLPLRALRIEMKIWEEKEFYKKIMEYLKLTVKNYEFRVMRLNDADTVTLILLKERKEDGSTR